MLFHIFIAVSVLASSIAGLPVIDHVDAPTTSSVAHILQTRQDHRFCHPRTANVCTYTWQAFTHDTPDGARTVRHEACLYNSVCRPLANELYNLDQPVKPSMKPLYHFATKEISELKGHDVYVVDYVRLKDNVLYAPIFFWNDEKFGGEDGCSCSGEGVDTARGAYWACSCPFPCAA